MWDKSTMCLRGARETAALSGPSHRGGGQRGGSSARRVPSGDSPPRDRGAKLSRDSRPPGTAGRTCQVTATWTENGQQTEVSPAPRTAETPLPVEFLLKRQRVGWLLKLSYGLPLLGEHL